MLKQFTQKSFILFVFTIMLIAVTGQAGAQNGTEESLEYKQAVQRGTQAVIWGMPAVSMMDLRKSAETQLGFTFNDIIYFSEPMVSRHGFLTPNNNVPYVMSVLNTKDGPVILDVPPASEKVIYFGSVIDAWQLPVTDVGPEGDDKGKGGKYLFLPPGYEGEVPEGYIVQRPKTFNLYVGLRPVAVNGGTLEEAVTYAKKLKAYPLSEAENPEPTRYINAFPKTWNTLPQYDMSFFEDLATVVNEEPVQEKDLVMMGMLPTIGIQKGAEFNPNEETTKALEQSLTLGYDLMQEYFTTPDKALVNWWSDVKWQAPNFPKAQAEAGFPMVTKDELLLDKRAGGMYFWATFLPKRLGKGSFYLMGLRDKSGEMFDGSSLYRLKVPKDVPAAQFWSAIVYSMKTKGFINNASKVGIGSTQEADLKQNEDGTIDIYFGPKAPEGMESNWLPTGEDFFLIFRLYGPEKALFDKTWTLPDVEKVG
ncbi:MAG: hypothetical protein DHS20C13_03070 [Thermodesulfobacteriota bacterium]|nr:MAG: hypothetical protein DHS20C13_03070 [Thermodesulfobacteriota bacterium]